jgi:hypothetical protein
MGANRFPGWLRTNANGAISRRWLIDLTVCVAVLMAAYAVRGWLLAFWRAGAFPSGQGRECGWNGRALLW